MEGSEKGDLRVEKRVQVEVEESELECGKSECKDAQVLLMSMAYTILSVLIKTCHRVSSICQLHRLSWRLKRCSWRSSRKGRGQIRN